MLLVNIYIISFAVSLTPLLSFSQKGVSPVDFVKLSARFRALSDPTRLRIILQLSAGEQNASDLLSHLSVSQPTLSYHMKELAASGLVTARRDGAWMHYRLNTGEIRKLCEFLELSEEKNRTQEIKRLLDKSAPESSRKGGKTTMKFSVIFDSPIGPLTLEADQEGLTGIFFGAKGPAVRKTSNPDLNSAIRWLTLYFSGRTPDFTPRLHPSGTVFQTAVWKELARIPYGRTTTYGTIAKKIASAGNRPRPAAQAVGGAVGHNPLPIIIPCHRVIGADGSLTGYSGGLNRKEYLLHLEGHSIVSGHIAS